MKDYVVNRADLAYNIEYLKERAKAPIWAVLKCNGYGLGTLALARECAAHEVDHFCVTEVSEAEELRANGFDKAGILMLRSTPLEEELRRLAELDVILTVGSAEVAEAVLRVTPAARVHIKIDTGMGRYGFRPTELEQIPRSLNICGIYTHFNMAFSNDALTKREYADFQTAVQTLNISGTVHCCNSSAFLKFPEMHCDAVRVGSALLGRMAFPTGLRPVGYARAQVESLRTLHPGETTGYAAVWRAKKDTRVAIVPIGSFHGLGVSGSVNFDRFKDRFLYGLSVLKGQLLHPERHVLIHGKRCRIIGAVGTLHCAVDVTHVACEIGDPVRVEISPLYVKGLPVTFE